jgi:HNH endonuclease
MEVFKGIFNDVYSVSNFGNVKRGERLLKPVKKNGYNSISISLKGVVVVEYVHRLVAKSFIDNPLNKKQVNHKNGIRTDNRVENLEWATNAENISHSFRELGRKMKGLRGDRNGMYKYRGANNKNSKPVICSNGMVYGSRKEAARELGINAGNITLICNGRRKTINGYSFSWKI